jgi:hypothetical protein
MHVCVCRWIYDDGVIRVAYAPGGYPDNPGNGEISVGYPHGGASFTCTGDCLASTGYGTCFETGDFSCGCYTEYCGGTGPGGKFPECNFSLNGCS